MEELEKEQGGPAAPFMLPTSRRAPGPGRQLALLGLLWLMGLLLTGGLALVLDSASTKALRITMMLQDILVWVAPAVVCAVLSSRVPADWLSVRHRPALPLLPTAGAVVAAVVSIPAMNALVAWNASLRFPEPLQGMLMAGEEAANAAVTALLGTGTAADLVMGILIVGVMAGLSEELFFRGALLRILSRRPKGLPGQGAVWLTALLFSLIHFQAFGFVPRLLLGAWFGYLLLWSGSLWVPVLAHALNNTMAVTSQWLVTRGLLAPDAVETFGLDSSALLAASVAATAAVVWAVRRFRAA